MLLLEIKILTCDCDTTDVQGSVPSDVIPAVGGPGFVQV